MENTLKQACRNCRFWVVSKFIAVPYSDETAGECHRHAPRSAILSCHDTAQDLQWLETKVDDWCGEWEQREKEGAKESAGLLLTEEMFIAMEDALPRIRAYLKSLSTDGGAA